MRGLKYESFVSVYYDMSQIKNALSNEIWKFESQKINCN